METRQNACLTEGNKRTNKNKSELQELRNAPSHLSITLAYSGHQSNLPPQQSL